MDIRESILDTIGRTPLVRLRRIFRKPGVEILLKLEGFNPMGSLKDRIAVWMARKALESGALKPGMTLVESSSGNTGIGLAMVAAALGMKALIAMSKKVSVERRKMMRALGAELVLVDGGSDEAWGKADEIAASDSKKYFRIHQYKSPANALCHYETTGPEIWEQTGGKVDAVVITLGTTGTLMGAGRFLKEKNPKLKIVTVEPSPVNTQQGIRNLRTQRVPDIFEGSLIDHRWETQDEEAYTLARRLALEEGVFAGISSGSCLAGTIRYAGMISRGVIVAVLPDRGEKYLSTPLFDGKGDPAVEAT
jgi:cysteine synthase